MAQHTPGPWTRDERDGRMREGFVLESAGIRGATGTFVAAALDFNRWDRDAEVEANARLIAVAPEMYALLESLHADLARYAKMTEEAWSSGSIAFDSMATNISRVLAKARGG